MMSVLLVLLGLTGRAAAGHGDPPNAGGRQDIRSLRAGQPVQDLRLTAGTLLTWRAAPGQHLLVCQGGFSITVAGRQYTGRHGLVWVTPHAAQTPGRPGTGYQLQMYLGGRVSSRKVGPEQESGLEELTVERGKGLVIRTSIDGEVFVTADNHETGSPWTLPLYREARTAFQEVGWSLPPVPESPERSGLGPASAGEPNRPATGSVINLAPLTDVAPKLERKVTDEGDEITTLIGRTYLWWEPPRDTNGRAAELIEVEADSFVIWRRAAPGPAGEGTNGTDVLAARMEGVSEIYVAGDVVFRQGQRTISADEMYYDLRQNRAVANNVVLRSFDPVRNVPIYVRAAQLRRWPRIATRRTPSS